MNSTPHSGSADPDLAYIISHFSAMNSKDLEDRCRMVVVSGVPDVMPNDRMNDKLTIHFQSTRSGGGDVEEVQYPTHLNGVAFITFENWRDADRVVKSKQVLKDKEFPEEYTLTVYKFTPEVAFYAFAEVDVSRFPDRSALVASLSSTHGSVRIEPSDTKPGLVSAEGPFSALRELRTDLLSRTRSLGDAQPSRAEAERPEVEGDSGPGGTECVSLWLDTHVYTYIQMMEKEAWDRCVSRFNVETEPVSSGEVTQVQLYGEASALRAAQAKLQSLVSERQGTLRTLHIDCDPAVQKQLLQACERAQARYREVYYIPTDSNIAVIGPSISSHLFCELVKILTDSLWV